MTEATQQEKATPPDTTVVVTGATMEAYVESKQSGGEFKPAADAPETPPQVAEQEADGDTQNEEQQPEAEPEAGKPEKTLTAKQIKANERWKAREEALSAEKTRADNAERAAAELRAKYEPAPVIPQAEPDPKTYSDAKQYAEDYSNWKDGQRQAKEAQEHARNHAKTVQESFEKNRDAFKKTVPDWDERYKERQGINMHTEVIEAIMESDFNAQIIYELTPDEMKKINNMPNMRDRIRAIGRMEAKFEKAKGEGTAPIKELSAAEEISRAPEPITPISTRQGGPVSRIDPKTGEYTGTQEQYEADYKAGKFTRH